MLEDKQNEDGGPAFPVTPNYDHGFNTTYSGMTMRDYFAAAALQGLLGNSQIAKDAVKEKIQPEENWRWHADTAYKFADAMLKERQS